MRAEPLWPSPRSTPGHPKTSAREPGATQPGQNHHQAFGPLASQASRRASPSEGGTDALAFATSVREGLAPTLKPGVTRDP
jgi:hypothetical protein